MKLIDLIKETKVQKIIGYIKDIDIKNISINSREKHSHALFIAQKGKNFDGSRFIEEAIINGAIAIVVEKEFKEYNIPQIIVNDSRKALSCIASTFYGNPKNKLKFLGVTGTNGKTSCALFLSQILNENGKKCAFIGTLGAFFKEKKYISSLTTPDPLVLHKLLSEFIEDGVEYVAMECSAHAIYLQKIFNIDFEVGIITNITQDHLDYFKTMKNYSKTKLNWVLSNTVKTAIVNCDDKYCKQILKNKEQILSYGLDAPADVFAVNIEMGKIGTTFVLNLLDNVIMCSSNLVGMFNVYNIMAIATAALCVGIKIDDLIKSISHLEAPTGRFNLITLNENKNIIVDFAHTPDGLEKALRTAREICKGKVIAVFGCGGDRDKLKRPIMGKIAEEFSDFVILTSDNPRFEKPETIMDDIEKGMVGHNYLKIADRRLAIMKMIEMLCPFDMAVLCGKGGELYQDVNGIKLPYNDFEEIEKCVKNIYGENYKMENKEKIC